MVCGSISFCACAARYLWEDGLVREKEDLRLRRRGVEGISRTSAGILSSLLALAVLGSFSERANQALPFTVTLTLSDDDFGKMASGNVNAQKLFMSGKLKVKGNVMAATKMEPILKKAQTKAKL